MWVRAVLVLLFSVMGFALAEAAATISLKRGLPTDIWLTWPDEKAWSEPGFLDVYPEWRKAYGPTHLKAVRAAGFDFMRLTVDPAPYISEATPARTAHMIAGVLQSVAEIKAAGLKVIVDLHAVPVSGRKAGTETYLRDEKSFATYLSFVAAMAQALTKEDPAWVAFEPINEPTIDCPWETGPNMQRWPAMALRLHDVARRAAPKLSIVMSGGCWGGAEGLTKLTPSAFKDANMYWSFHSYEPFLISHQGASWTDGPTKFIRGLSYPPDKSQKNKILNAAASRIKASPLAADAKRAMADNLRNDIDSYFTPGRVEKSILMPFELVQHWATENGVLPGQIILGEFGVIKQDQDAPTRETIRVALMEKTRRLAEDAGMAWSVWCWGGSFGITQEEAKREFSPAILKALGLGEP